jgi:hypothetical protein
MAARLDFASPEPERATLSDAEHGIVQEPPFRPAIVELVRFLARRAARQWFAQQTRANDEDGE